MFNSSMTLNVIKGGLMFFVFTEEHCCLDTKY